MAFHHGPYSSLDFMDDISTTLSCEVKRIVVLHEGYCTQLKGREITTLRTIACRSGSPDLSLTGVRGLTTQLKTFPAMPARAYTATNFFLPSTLSTCSQNTSIPRQERQLTMETPKVVQARAV